MKTARTRSFAIPQGQQQHMAAQPAVVSPAAAAKRWLLLLPAEAERRRWLRWYWCVEDDDVGDLIMIGFFLVMICGSHGNPELIVEDPVMY